MTGCSMAPMALKTKLRPVVPPGRKLTRYHRSATSCTPDATRTRTYPLNPPLVQVRYNVASILPRYIVVKSIRSEANMDTRCSYGPFRIPKLAMKVSDPHVKLSANFCGFNASIGTPTKKARAKKSADKKRSAQNT